MRTAASLSLILLASCASTPQRESVVLPVEGAVEELSSQIVSTARLRTDLSGMRVCVHDIQAREGASARSAAIGDALEREFVVALSNDLNLLDAEFSGADAPSLEVDGPSSVGEHHGATHLLVGSYHERGEDLVVTVRLIDAESHLIVSAARGTVSKSEFEDLSGWNSGLVSEPEPGEELPEPASFGPSLANVGPTAPGPAGPTAVAAAGGPTAPGPAGPGAVSSPRAGPVAPSVGRRKPDRAWRDADYADDLPTSTGPAGRRLKRLGIKPAAKE